MTSLEINKIHQGNCFDLLPLVQDHSIDAIITDPPYGILKGHRIETNVDIPRFFAECKRVMKPNAFIAFFGMMPTLLEWCNEAMKCFKYSDHIVWAKRMITAIAQPINRTHESIMIYGSGNYFKTKGKYDDVKQPLVDIGILSNESIYKNTESLNKQTRGVNTNRGAGRRHDPYHNYMGSENKYPRGVETCNFTNLWSFMPHNRGNIGDGINHPTVKPIELLKRLVELLTPEPTDDYTPSILDPFMGSGTTALACQSLNRNFIGIELYPDYVEIANKRLLQARNLFTDTKFTQPTNDATMNELDAKQKEMF